VSELPPTDPVATPPDATPPPTASAPRARPRGGRAWIGWLLLILVVIGAAWGWQQWQLTREEQREAVNREQSLQTLQRRIEDLETALEGTRRNQRALETRASDNAATNKVLREELLGMGERAALLEDAVARLAENRLRGEMILRLNEAEFLLMLGEERLRLFGDAPATIQAYLLADAALAGLDDPVLATLRQTLAQELIALRAIPLDVRPTLRAELSRLADDVAALPATRVGAVAATDANDSRLTRLLGQLVTIRRLDARDALLGPAQREAALAALRLQLEQAQAALARPDSAAFTHALAQAGTSMTRLFDAGDAEVVRRKATLERLAATQLLPELPVLGATLRELRGLRATRSVAELPAALEPVAPAEPPVVTPEPTIEPAAEAGE
jgi:uroporphyrin-3 C-methyltransferase